MRRRSMLMNVGSSAPPDADAALWELDVIANGGTVSSLDRIVVNTIIQMEKARGTWILTDDYFVFWLSNEIAARTSLKQRRLATPAGDPAPVFTQYRGYTFNGTTNYLDTGFIPSTHAVAMTGTKMRGMIYCTSEQSSTSYAFGSISSAISKLAIRPNNSGSMSFGLNCSNTTKALNVNSSLGLIGASRDGSTFTSWQRGVTCGTSVPTSTDVTLPSRNMLIGAITDNAGVVASYFPGSIGLVIVGAALTADQELAQHNNVQQSATTVGAQV